MLDKLLKMDSALLTIKAQIAKYTALFAADGTIDATEQAFLNALEEDAKRIDEKLGKVIVKAKAVSNEKSATTEKTEALAVGEVEKTAAAGEVETVSAPESAEEETEDIDLGDDEVGIDGKKDTDDIEEFLDERNIQDTKPIIILTFKKFVGITVGHLKKLKAKVDLVRAKAHDKDIIKVGVVNAIDTQFATGESHSYDAKNFIQNSISSVLKTYFNGKVEVPLAEFCFTLSGSIEDLITAFQGDLKTLKKNYGKKYARYTRYPYPSVGDMLTLIKTFTVKFDGAGEKARIDKLLAELDKWYQEMLANTASLLNQYKDDYFDIEKLKLSLQAFYSSHQTFSKYTKYLTADVISKLPTDKLSNTELILKGVVENIKKLKDDLVIDILTTDETSKLAGNDDAPGFIGIVPIEYKNALERDTVAKSNFEEYLKLLRDKLDDIDNYVNDMATQEEWIKYSYRVNDLITLLDPLFNAKGEPLANLEKLSKTLTPMLRAKGTAFISISDIDEAIGAAIDKVKSSLEADVEAIYKTMLADGTADEALADLGRVLPTTNQVQSAINKSKIDIILNREIQYLKFEATLTWNKNRATIIEKVVDFLINQLNLSGLLDNIANAINKVAGGTVKEEDWIKWVYLIKDHDWLPDIPFPFINFKAVIITLLSEILEKAVTVISAIVKALEEALRVLIREIFGKTKPTDVTIRANIPVALELDLDDKGKPYAIGVPMEISGGTMLDVMDTAVYELSPEDPGPISVSLLKSKKMAMSESYAKLKFLNPGYEMAINIGFVFVAEIGVGGSEILDSRELPIYFDYKIQSSFNADNTVSISLINVVPRIEASFPELNGSPLTVITQTSKSIKAF